MGISDSLYTSIDSYFSTLNKFGYKLYTEVNKLLIYSFILELLEGYLGLYITENDYRKIEQALNCLYGSTCLIPYPQYSSGSSFLPIYNINCNLRETQEGLFKLSSDFYFRKTES